MIVKDRCVGIVFIICMLIYNTKPIIIQKETSSDNSIIENETYFDSENDNLVFDVNTQAKYKMKEILTNITFLFKNLSKDIEKIEFSLFPEHAIIQDKDDPKIFIKIKRINFIVTNDNPCNIILEFSKKLFNLRFKDSTTSGLYKKRIIINNQNTKLFCYKIDENDITQILDNHDQMQNLKYEIVDASPKKVSIDTNLNRKDHKTQDDIKLRNLLQNGSKYLEAEEQIHENEIPLLYDNIRDDRSFLMNETDNPIQTSSLEENKIEANLKEANFFNKGKDDTLINQNKNRHIDMSIEKQNSLATNKIPTSILISQTHKLSLDKKVKSSSNNDYYGGINTTSPSLNIEDKYKQENKQSDSVIDDFIFRKKIITSQNDFLSEDDTQTDIDLKKYFITTDGPDNHNNRLKYTTEPATAKKSIKLITLNSIDEDKEQFSNTESYFPKTMLTSKTEDILERTTANSILNKSNHEDSFIESTTKTDKIYEKTTKKNKPDVNNNSTTIITKKSDSGSKTIRKSSDFIEPSTTKIPILESNNLPVFSPDYDNPNPKKVKQNNVYDNNQPNSIYESNPATSSSSKDNEAMENVADVLMNKFPNLSKKNINRGRKTAGKRRNFEKKLKVNDHKPQISELNDIFVADHKEKAANPNTGSGKMIDNNDKFRKPSNNPQKVTNNSKTHNNNLNETTTYKNERPKILNRFKNTTNNLEPSHKNNNFDLEETPDFKNVNKPKKNHNQDIPNKPLKRNETSYNTFRKTTKEPFRNRNLNKTSDFKPYSPKYSTLKPLNENYNQYISKNGSILQNKIFEKAENFTKFNTKDIITKVEDKLDTIDNFMMIGKVGFSILGFLFSLLFLMKCLKFFGCKK